MPRTSKKAPPTKEEMIADLKKDLRGAFDNLFDKAGKLDAGNFCANLSQITFLFGRLRRYTLVNYGFKYKKYRPKPNTRKN